MFEVVYGIVEGHFVCSIGGGSDEGAVMGGVNFFDCGGEVYSGFEAPGGGEVEEGEEEEEMGESRESHYD